MSWYHTYYLGYRERNNKDGKIFPLGPFDDKGNYKNVLCKSRSFASNLYEYFENIDVDLLSKEFVDALEVTNVDELSHCLKMLPLNDLPKEDYIKSGYYLIQDIEEYIRNKGEYSIKELGIFYEKLSPEIYSLRLNNEITFKKETPKKRVDCEGNEYDIHPCSDYAYFCYPDYSSKEYESFAIRQIAEVFEFWSSNSKDLEIVVIEIEG